MYEQCPNGCNDFLSFSCELDAENDRVLYRCYVCDWEKMESNPFYVSAWIVSVNQAVATIDIIQSLMTDDSMTEFLRPRLKGDSFLSNRDSYAWKFTVGSDRYLLGEVNIAFQTYLRQMVVLAATYAELILKDFFDSFFTARPSYLTDLLAKNDSFRNRIVSEVSFDKIMNGDAKETMINHAYNSMRREDSWRVIKDLAKRSPIKLDRDRLFYGLKALTELRDDIVHNSLYESSGENEMNVQKVYDDFKLIINLLCILEKVAAKHEIPYWKEFECEIDELVK